MPRPIVSAILGSQSGSGEGGGGGTPGGGGGTPPKLSGNDVETLFDGAHDDVSSGTPNWGRSIDLPFGRALIEDDDSKDLRVILKVTGDGSQKNFDYNFSAKQFRELVVYADTSGSGEPDAYILGEGVDGRTGRTLSSLFARNNIIVRNRNADENDVLRIVLSASNNPSSLYTDIEATVYLVPRINSLAIVGDGGGGSGVEGWISPKDSYDEEDEGKFFIKNNTQFRVDLDHQDGHSASAAFLTLNSSDFRGFHSSSDQVSAPANGDFFANYVYGDFEIYRTSQVGGHTGLTGWYNFDPTEAGEVWDEIDNAGETLILTWAPGSLIHNIADLPRLASGTGEVFMDRAHNRIIAVSEYTAAEEEYNAWKPRIYTPPVGTVKPQTAYFWMRGSTKRVDIDEEDTDSANWPYYPGLNSTQRMRFNANGPDEALYGWSYGNIFVAAAGVDDLGVPAIDTSEVTFTLPAGVWDLDFYALASGSIGQTAQVRLIQAVIGSDNFIRGDAPGFTNSPTSPYAPYFGGAFQIKARDFETDGTELLYVRTNSTHGSARYAGFLRVRRAG